MKKSNLIVTTFNLDKKLHRATKAHCATKGITLVSLVVKLLTSYLKDNGVDIENS